MIARMLGWYGCLPDPLPPQDGLLYLLALPLTQERIGLPMLGLHRDHTKSVS